MELKALLTLGILALGFHLAAIFLIGSQDFFDLSELAWESTVGELSGDCLANMTCVSADEVGALSSEQFGLLEDFKVSENSGLTDSNKSYGSESLSGDSEIQLESSAQVEESSWLGSFFGTTGSKKSNGESESDEGSAKIESESNDLPKISGKLNGQSDYSKSDISDESDNAEISEQSDSPMQEKKSWFGSMFGSTGSKESNIESGTEVGSGRVDSESSDLPKVPNDQSDDSKSDVSDVSDQSDHADDAKLFQSDSSVQDKSWFSSIFGREKIKNEKEPRQLDSESNDLTKISDQSDDLASGISEDSHPSDDLESDMPDQPGDSESDVSNSEISDKSDLKNSPVQEEESQWYSYFVSFFSSNDSKKSEGMEPKTEGMEPESEKSSESGVLTKSEVLDQSEDLESDMSSESEIPDKSDSPVREKKSWFSFGFSGGEPESKKSASLNNLESDLPNESEIVKSDPSDSEVLGQSGDKSEDPDSDLSYDSEISDQVDSPVQTSWYNLFFGSEQSDNTKSEAVRDSKSDQSYDSESEPSKDSESDASDNSTRNSGNMKTELLCLMNYTVHRHSMTVTGACRQMYIWSLLAYDRLYIWWYGDGGVSVDAVEAQHEVSTATPPPFILLLIQEVAFFFMEAVMILTLFCCICCPRTICKKSEFDLRVAQRIQQEKEERAAAERGMSQVEVKGDWGSRLQKYWFLSDEVIITKAPKPKNCFLDLTVHQEGLNEFLKLKVRDLPYVQPISSFEYMSEEERIVVRQPFHECGSLRDLIHKEDPLSDWSEKYLTAGEPLPPLKVASYGAQILRAMTKLYLLSYDEVPLCPLEHVHVGNIFPEGDSCLLGGYENKLLGYRPRIYRTVLEHNELQNIDIIMFGHVIYEMVSGRELKGLFPTEEDYSCVADGDCKAVLQYIFTRKHGIKKLREHVFFKGKADLMDPGVCGRTPAVRKERRFLFRQLFKWLQKLRKCLCKIFEDIRRRFKWSNRKAKTVLDVSIPSPPSSTPPSSFPPSPPPSSPPSSSPPPSSPSSTYTSVSSTHTSPSHTYSPLSPRDPGPPHSSSTPIYSTLLKKLPGPFSRKDKRKQYDIVISKPLPASPSSAPSYLRTTTPSASRSRSFTPSSSADSAKHTSICTGFSLALCIIISLYVVLYLLVILLVVLF